MSQLIELAAIVAREGKIFLVRSGDSWLLPGEPLADGADVDEAMDAVLERFGVRTPAIEEDFLQTVYLRRNGVHSVLNLYGPTEWTGEPSDPDGRESAWFGLGDLPTLPMDHDVRKAVLEVLGLAQPAGDDELLAAIGQELGAAAPDGNGTRRFASKREAGLDVLGTLNAMDGGKAAKSMYDMYGALTDDVLEFALGSVWADEAIDRRTKSLQVVAMVAALGQSGPLRSHINGALNHGATPEQLVQTMRLVAVYAGFPVALEAWRVMEKVFASHGIKLEGAKL
ncbi:MAG: carboxymuconolactone decarboxylase family protein [Hyphomicrobiales bacterium]